ncbi:uncharacterized protein LOC127749929 [Frankliniella occidentalis]|uniref:Uncharacterized protein LOC127749929 n=1 Tax=Frankliniella occidentalis TaxID=133901 RepID=A0A9C6U240_FRAOC|nr:uncharacterized protein LOC127749929 [Frankliniella occidentalis]
MAEGPNAAQEQTETQNFFKRYNSENQNSVPTYMPISKLPLFLYFQLTSIGPFTTSVGPTARVQCKIQDDQEVFFFLNRIGFAKFTNPAEIQLLQNCITETSSPFVFIAKTTRAPRVVFVPFSEEINEQYITKSKVRISKIPEGVPNQMKFI